MDGANYVQQNSHGETVYQTKQLRQASWVEERCWPDSRVSIDRLAVSTSERTTSRTREKQELWNRRGLARIVGGNAEVRQGSELTNSKSTTNGG